MSDYYFDQAAADRAIMWVEEYCTHVIGEKKGQPVVFEDWQKKIYYDAFGWKIKGSDQLRYSTIYTEIPRGNGKTTFAICTGLYIGFGAGINASRVYCVASSKDQAGDSIFEPAKLMVEQEPALNETLSLYYNSVIDYDTDSKFKLLSADWRGAHSLIASAIIFDEMHLQPNDQLYNGFRSGMAKRTDCTPQMWIFTTAGEKETFAERVHNMALSVKKGEVQKDSWLVNIWAAEEKDDIFSEKTWESVNPGWSFINQREFKENADLAEKMPSALNTFKRYNLNIWTGNTESWIPMHEWEACKLVEANIEDFAGMPCWGGLDLASVRDLSSLCLFFEDDDGILHGFWRFWCPKKQIYARSYHGIPYEQWYKDGFITGTPGDAQDYGYIKDQVLEAAKAYDVQMIRYDPKFASQLVIELTDEGVEMEPLGQGINSLAEPTKAFERFVVEKKINHGGNPVMNWQVSSCDVKRVGEVVRPVKKSENLKIDGIYSAIFAISAYIDLGSDGQSATRTKGVALID